MWEEFRVLVQAPRKERGKVASFIGDFFGLDFCIRWRGNVRDNASDALCIFLEWHRTNPCKNAIGFRAEKFGPRKIPARVRDFERIDVPVTLGNFESNAVECDGAVGLPLSAWHTSSKGAAQCIGSW